MLGTVSANIRISGIPAVPTLMDRVHQEHKYNKHTNISLKINTGLCTGLIYMDMYRVM